MVAWFDKSDFVETLDLRSELTTDGCASVRLELVEGQDMTKSESRDPFAGLHERSNDSSNRR